jgi:hypothetical protein
MHAYPSRRPREVLRDEPGRADLYLFRLIFVPVGVLVTTVSSSLLTRP